jgi:hypothetical protein
MIKWLKTWNNSAIESFAGVHRFHSFGNNCIQSCGTWVGERSQERLSENESKRKLVRIFKLYVKPYENPRVRRSHSSISSKSKRDYSDHIFREHWLEQMNNKTKNYINYVQLIHSFNRYLNYKWTLSYGNVPCNIYLPLSEKHEMCKW